MYSQYNIDFNPEKNLLLQLERGICFDDIVPLIAEAKWIDVTEHPNPLRKQQKIFYFDIDNEIYVVPFVINEDEMTLFLKTVYPSRQARKLYKGS